MVVVKSCKFLHCFFLSTFGLEKVFCDVLYRKLAIFDHKNIVLKKSQICIFSKGLVYGFDAKFEISLSVLLRQIWPRKSVR